MDGGVNKKIYETECILLKVKGIKKEHLDQLIPIKNKITKQKNRFVKPSILYTYKTVSL